MMRTGFLMANTCVHKWPVYLRRDQKNYIRALIKWMNKLCFIVVVLSLNKFLTLDFDKLTLHKKWSFPLKISSVNVTKSAVSCKCGHNYWRNPRWKTSFFVQWKISITCTWQMLCLHYSNLQETRIISKLYMTGRRHWFPAYGLGNKCA